MEAIKEITKQKVSGCIVYLEASNTILKKLREL